MSGTFDAAEFFSRANAIRDRIPVKEVETEKETKQESPTQKGLVYLGTSGIRVSPKGIVSKKEFLDKLEVDHSRYEDLKFSEQEVAKIRNRMNSSTAGVSSAVPMICMGTSCPFASSCVYIEIDKAPLGRACLVEAQLITYWVEQYMDEFNVEPSRPSEVHLVSELAEINAYEMRVTKYLAEQNPTLLQDFESTNSMGDSITNKEISRAFEVKEKLKKSRMKILEALMATREKQAKIAVQMASHNPESSMKFADLAEKMAQMKKDMMAMRAGKREEAIVDGEIVGENK